MIASRLVECSQKLGTFVVSSTEYQSRDRSIGLGSTGFLRQASGIDPPAFAADRGEFDHILEFVDVAGPGIGAVSAIVLPTRFLLGVNGVKRDFARFGKPVDNALSESFNVRSRDECLNEQVCVSLPRRETED